MNRIPFFITSFSSIILGLFSCNKIHSGEQLTAKDVRQIECLGLLNPREKIYQFYSNAPFKTANAGNFYSTERIAHYWLDNDTRKNQVNFCYYKDIMRIDTTYLDKSLTYVSYMTISRKDATHFQVYVGGKKPAVKAFFEDAMAHWKAVAFPAQ